MKRTSSGFGLRFSFLLLASLTIFLTLTPATGLSQTKSGTDDYALSALEKAVLEEMNLARANPAQYATYLEAWRKYYQGKMFKQPGVAAVETIEGSAGLDRKSTRLNSSHANISY